MFRCAVRTDEGVSFVRLVQAPSREQAILLLLAQGLEPLSVARDIPSLANRLEKAVTHVGGSARPADALLRLIAGGLTVEASARAWADLPANAAIPACFSLPDRIATGQPLALALQPCENMPDWMTGALALARDRSDEQAMLLEMDGIRARTERAYGLLRRAGVEAAILLAMIALLASTAFQIAAGTTIAIAVGIALLALFPGGPIGPALRDVRASDMLSMAALLQAWGAAPTDAVALACRRACDRRARAQIEDNLTQFASPLRLDLVIGGPIGLSPMDAAILRYGEPEASCVRLSISLAKHVRRRAGGLVRALRLIAVAAAALVLVTIRA